MKDALKVTRLNKAFKDFSLKDVSFTVPAGLSAWSVKTARERVQRFDAFLDRTFPSPAKF